MYSREAPWKRQSWINHVCPRLQYRRGNKKENCFCDITQRRSISSLVELVEILCRNGWRLFSNVLISKTMNLMCSRGAIWSRNPAVFITDGCISWLHTNRGVKQAKTWPQQRRLTLPLSLSIPTPRVTHSSHSILNYLFVNVSLSETELFSQRGIKPPSWCSSALTPTAISAVMAPWAWSSGRRGQSLNVRGWM